MSLILGSLCVPSGESYRVGFQSFVGRSLPDSRGRQQEMHSFSFLHLPSALSFLSHCHCSLSLETDPSSCSRHSLASHSPPSLSTSFTRKAALAQYHPAAATSAAASITATPLDLQLLLRSTDGWVSQVFCAETLLFGYRCSSSCKLKEKEKNEQTTLPYCLYNFPVWSF